MNSGPLKQLSHMLLNGYYLNQHHWAVVVLKWSEHPHAELGAKDGNTTTPKNIFSSNFSRLIMETGLFYSSRAESFFLVLFLLNLRHW